MLNFGLLAFQLVRGIEPAGADATVLRGRALEIVDDRGRVRASIKLQPAGTANGVRYPETVMLRRQGRAPASPEALAAGVEAGTTSSVSIRGTRSAGGNRAGHRWSGRGPMAAVVGRSWRVGRILAGAGLMLLAAGAAEAHLSIVIDKDTQRMTVVVDGVTRHRWPVSTGRAGQPTPNGRFRLLTLVRDEHSRTYDNAPMPYAIYFTNDGHAIHGSRAGLGAPASRGCVRLGVKQAATLFALAKRHGRKKTVIRIVGRDPHPDWADAGPR